MVGTVIVGGGKSERFNDDKIFYNINSYPLIFYTLIPFIKCNKVEKIVLVLSKEKSHEGVELFKNFNKIVAIVEGGKERKESVLNGLKYFYENEKIDYVLIHDGARPNIKIELIEKVIQNLDENSCVIPVISVTETIKYIENKNTIKTLDRDKLFITQTPQGFPFLKLYNLLNRYLYEKFFDESTLFEKEGLPIKIIDGDIENIKVTYKSDILKVLDFIKKNESRYRF
ncbi:MAG: IspD/TarI family cytidylyltransferase [Caldisericia bacterium]|jgi:2-C-methyl-D-erythritol 4-phosphate cytidylyltransferase|nr:IspD/TarI family cytidylyltransferase [Caldisericia bacterium]